MDYEIAEPKPSSLIESLRSVGYSLPTAIADIIDNSIAAKASEIKIHFNWSGSNSSVCILDNGKGMTESELHEAMRPGSQSPLESRSQSDLGRFGLGLKTASFSQCRELCVISKPLGGTVSTRTWDLGYVAKHNEWRLLKETTTAAKQWLRKVDQASSGTVVVWSDLDRLTGGDSVGDAAAHQRFNDAIEQVGEHLALTFHRFLEDRSLNILINAHPVKAWNPFMENHATTYKTPIETILFGNSRVIFRGYVLPHKDKLNEKEFRENAGPRGWSGQQGFYIYRNRRLLAYGDWLRLGKPNPWTREEHYRLARICLDLNNDADADWQLDVKKSTARPPGIIRERLAELAESVRSQARTVFAHRGKYGPKAPAPTTLERPWVSTIQGNRRAYRVNREHPLVRSVLADCSDCMQELECLLRLLEETVPVEQIWLDTAEQIADPAAPYECRDYTLIREDMRRTLKYLTCVGINHATAIARIRTIAPFDRYPKLIDEI